jgi:hypothetical protein
MPKRTAQFQTIHTEGAILPPDILRSIAALAVDGVSADSYHLPPNTKLNEAISQAWTALLAHWKAFREAREKLPAHEETGTALTNERWLLPLFKELDYGRLTTSRSPEIDGRTYSIERFYQHAPIHLIGCNLPLDRRTRGARGAATASPHSMIQEYLNRADNSLWGFVSNGLWLRILRDNVSLSRQAYVEFDLEAMFDGEVYSDFAMLWMLCHQSRVEAEKAPDCWLEKWSKLARDRGTRVLDDLRVGVTSAIEALGRGFIAHPKNDRLRDKLRSGAVTTQDYYRQLLRVVYRLLFLFVAEDRGLLHPPDAGEDACQLYDEYYSTSWLRELCRAIRGSKHGDLWHTLSLVIDALGSGTGLPQLGLPALGSFLWRRSSTADLVGPAAKSASPVDEAVNITNDDLLSAVRALAYVQQDKVLRDVDYRNLGSEELGSVYESLLELHPEMNIEGRSFSLSVAAGHERKTTGSYYTPDSLVQCLLDSALEPVVAERIKGLKADEAEQAILKLKVCDPACGSGHFLIAAAHRLARHLARVRTGESEPSPEDHQHALRDIIGRCIYGVDLNPMAVELCKVSLWIEAIEPGKPLSFLDHHIQCGNSLLGTTPALLAKGIPDDAFQPTDCDEKSICSELKKDNKRERKSYERGVRDFQFTYELGNLPVEFARLTAGLDESVADAESKEKIYADLVKGANYQNACLLADAWCAAFVWKKEKSELGRLCLTERGFRNLQSSPSTLLPYVRTEIECLRRQYQFFHWHLAFPDIFRLPTTNDSTKHPAAEWIGGFDIVIGNPPWDKVELLEKEWFSSTRQDIANASTAAKRKTLISKLEQEDPTLFAAYLSATRQIDATRHFIRDSGRFPLCGVGRVNTYSAFAETNRLLTGHIGRTGAVLPSGILTDDSTKLFVQDLLNREELVSFFDFDNRQGLFPTVQGNVKFCLLTLSRQPTKTFDCAAQLGSPADLSDSQRRYRLSVDDIVRINPNTLNCPTFATARDALLVARIHSVIPVVVRETPSEVNPWGISFRQGLFNMTTDSDEFMTREELDNSGWHLVGNSFVRGAEKALPLYEAKLTNQFNHRAATFDGIRTEDRFKTHAGTVESSSDRLDDPGYCIIPRYWVDATLLLDESIAAHGWFVGFRNAISAVADSRSLVATIVPFAGVGNSMPLIFFGKEIQEPSSFVAALNSFVVDYVLRQKASGGNLNFYVFKQLPVPIPNLFSGQSPWDRTVSVGSWFTYRVLELSYTSWDLSAFAKDSGYEGSPFHWDAERRFLLRCELDAAMFHVYLCAPDEWGGGSEALRGAFASAREAVSYILDTFPIIRRRDEEQHSEFRTKRVILEMYDQMADAIRTGEPYQTKLNPPPADPRVAHPPRAQQLAYGDVVADILLLLHEWNSAVSILALEPAVLLMQNEQARNAFMGQSRTAVTTDQSQPTFKVVEGIDLVYQGLVVNGAIEPVGQNGYRLLKPELIADLSAENRQRAKKVVAAIRKLDRPEDALAIVAEVTHERYAVVS